MMQSRLSQAANELRAPTRRAWSNTPWQARRGFPAHWAARPPRYEAVDAQINELAAPVTASPLQLRLLTFNIQVGIKTSKYRHYVTNGWKHVWPHEERQNNLARIADLVEDYDVVALQEVDSGSLRSGFRNQVEYLAEQASFPYWYTQTNRDLGMFAQHGNGLLSRVQPGGLEDHKLPGALPGRGAIFVRIPFGSTTLTVVLLHLSLGTPVAGLAAALRR